MKEKKITKNPGQLLKLKLWIIFFFVVLDYEGYVARADLTV